MGLVMLGSNSSQAIDDMVMVWCYGFQLPWSSYVDFFKYKHVLLKDSMVVIKDWLRIEDFRIVLFYFTLFFIVLIFFFSFSMLKKHNTKKYYVA